VGSDGSIADEVVNVAFAFLTESDRAGDLLE
jgi:hypothetical protein